MLVDKVFMHMDGEHSYRPETDQLNTICNFFYCISVNVSNGGSLPKLSMAHITLGPKDKPA